MDVEGGARDRHRTAPPADDHGGRPPRRRLASDRLALLPRSRRAQARHQGTRAGRGRPAELPPEPRRPLDAHAPDRPARRGRADPRLQSGAHARRRERGRARGRLRGRGAGPRGGRRGADGARGRARRLRPGRRHRLVRPRARLARAAGLQRDADRRIGRLRRRDARHRRAGGCLSPRRPDPRPGRTRPPPVPPHHRRPPVRLGPRPARHLSRDGRDRSGWSRSA